MKQQKTELPNMILRVRELMENAGIRQKDVAKRMCVSSAYINGFLCGRVPSMPLSNLEEMCTIVNAPIELEEQLIANFQKKRNLFKDPQIAPARCQEAWLSYTKYTQFYSDPQIMKTTLNALSNGAKYVFLNHDANELMKTAQTLQKSSPAKKTLPTQLLCIQGPEWLSMVSDFRIEDPGKVEAEYWIIRTRMLHPMRGIYGDSLKAEKIYNYLAPRIKQVREGTNTPEFKQVYPQRT